MAQIKQTKGLSFSQALEALKVGHKLAREGWNGKGMWIILIPGQQLVGLQPGSPYKNALREEYCDILPHIDMWTVNSEGRRAMLPGWVASQSDLLSEDWMIID